MNDRHDDVEQAIDRLRRVLSEHERSGDPDTPFHMGIREVLAEHDGYAADTESAA